MNGRMHAALALVFVVFMALPGMAGAQGPSKSECAKAGLKSCVALSAFVVSLRTAVNAGDKDAVAALFSYPIEIQLKDGFEVRDKAALVKNYDTIMTKAVRDAMLTQEPFVNSRQIIQMIGDGAQIWLTVEKGRLLIGTVIIE